MHSSAICRFRAGLQPTLAETERCARAFGQQITPAARGLGQFGDRRGFLLGGDPPP